MTRLVWRAQALDDLETIISYIADQNLPASQRLHAAIEACAEMLTRHPLAFRPGRVDGTREAVVHPNYILIYRVVRSSDRDRQRRACPAAISMRPVTPS